MTSPGNNAQNDDLRERVAEWLDANYGEHTQQRFEAFLQAADELLRVVAGEEA